jgi:excinuclease ABC subunit A
MGRGNTLYILDEPTTGLHPADVEKLMTQLDGLVDAGNTVIVVEHDMRVVVGSDWVIDIGPGAGDEGGHVVASGPPAEVAKSPASRTAPYLARFLGLDAASRRAARPARGGAGTASPGAMAASAG